MWIRHNIHKSNRTFCDKKSPTSLAFFFKFLQDGVFVRKKLGDFWVYSDQQFSFGYFLNVTLNTQIFLY